VDSASASLNEERPPSAWRKAAGFALGVTLLAAAVYAAWGQREVVIQALAEAAGARWWLIALALTLPLCNWVLSSALFMLLMEPGQAKATRRVRFAEMLWLIGASWLLNYLPLAPGLFGRVAYHRRVHGIPVRFTAQAIGTGMVVSAGVLGSALLVGAVGVLPEKWGMFAALLSLAAIAFLCGVIARARGRAWWWAAMAVGVRCLDIATWAARYATVMALLNVEWTIASAAAIGVVSQVAILVPMVGNGLGIREWAVGLLGPVLPSWFRGAAAMTRGVGLTVDLVNRACELVVAVPVGLLSAASLARGVRATPPD
jgi:hypothetical protein